MFSLIVKDILKWNYFANSTNRDFKQDFYWHNSLITVFNIYCNIIIVI